MHSYVTRCFTRGKGWFSWLTVVGYTLIESIVTGLLLQGHVVMQTNTLGGNLPTPDKSAKPISPSGSSLTHYHFPSPLFLWLSS